MEPSDILRKFCNAINCSGYLKSDGTCFACKAFMLDQFVAFAEHQYWDAEREGMKEG